MAVRGDRPQDRRARPLDRPARDRAGRSRGWRRGARDAAVARCMRRSGRGPCGGRRVGRSPLPPAPTCDAVQEFFAVIASPRPRTIGTDQPRRPRAARQAHRADDPRSVATRRTVTSAQTRTQDTETRPTCPITDADHRQLVDAGWGCRSSPGAEAGRRLVGRQSVTRRMNDRVLIHASAPVMVTSAAKSAPTGMCGRLGVIAARRPSAT